MRESRRMRLLVSAGLTAFGGVLFAHTLWRNRDFVHDDSYIVLRYVHNFLSGDGLVWNVGEYVEGYTSFASVMLIAAVGALGVELPAAARWVGGVGAVAAAAVVLRFGFSDDRLGQPVLCALMAAWVLGYYPLGVWVMGGLDAPLFAAAITAGCAALAAVLERDGPRRCDVSAALLLGAAVLVRPDGALFALAGAGFYALRFLRWQRRSVLRVARFWACTAALPAIHLIWRYAYYQELVPNSVVARIYGLPSGASALGFAYLERFLNSPPYIGWIALLLLCLGVERRHRWPVAFLAVSATGYAAGIAGAGGDHMPESRLLAPLFPVLALLVVYQSNRLRTLGRWATTAAVGVGVALMIYAIAASETHQSDAAAFIGTIVGRHLQSTQPAGTVVALNTAGSTPYFAADLKFIDMLGLTDAHIARRSITRFQAPLQHLPGHSKGDGSYVLSRRPDIVIIGPAEGWPVERALFLSDLELQQNSAFLEAYRLRKTEIDTREIPRFGQYRASRSGALTLQYYERR
jgi:arabinofuranosyltransferase